MPRPAHPLHRAPRLLRADLPAGACLCDHCSGKCCRYFSLPIKTPRTWDDYDEIRWFLAHGQTLVYVEDATWYVLFMTPCQYLTADQRCAIYHDRPKICQDYTTADCEYDSDWTFDQVFEAPDQIVEYAEIVLPPRRRRRVSTPEGLVVLNSVSMPGQRSRGHHDGPVTL